MKAFSYVLTFIFIALVASLGIQTANVYKCSQSYIEINNPFQNIKSSLVDLSVDLPEIIVEKEKVVSSVKPLQTPVKKVKKRFYRRLPALQISTSKKNFSVAATSIAPVSYKQQSLQYLNIGSAVDGEIDNRELIAHNGFEVENPVYLSMSSLFDGNRLMAEYKELQRLEDRARKAMAVVPAAIPELKEVDEIQVSLSSNEKKHREFKIDSDLDTKTEDTPKFDYSPETVAADQAAKWNEFKSEKKAAVVSAAVRSAITHAKKINHTVAATSSGVKKHSPKRSAPLSIDQTRKFIDDVIDSKVSSQNNSMGFVPLTTQSSRVVIQGVEANFGVGFTDDISNFQFVPEYDRNQSIDDIEGEIVVEDLLSSGAGTIRGTLIKSGYVRTVVDLTILRSKKPREINLPFIEKRSYHAFLDKHKLNGLGGHLLVELDDSVVDVDLDAKYETKLYFDGDFKLVDFNGDYSFVLYVGVAPGNAMISYLLDGRTRAEKVVHISDGDLYFDINKIMKGKQRRISLVERGPFGTGTVPLALDEKEVVYFNTNRTAKELVPGIFSLATPVRPQGFRNYLELKHIEGSIFVGTQNKDTIEVPSYDLITEILGLYRLNSLEGVCVIQLNLSKRPLSVKFAGSTATGGMNITERFIEKSGAIADEVSELTQKVVFLGERQGVINLRIEYLDDSVELLQTICSESTYLVEQL